ncbi:MAG: hypothetical protein ACR2FI_10315 [Burkholderiales bacterium]|nr:hypothetical protein [Burkholderiales bacterium]
MNRDEMIKKLVSYSVETALRNPQAEWTRRILVKGFDGFHRMPPKKLERELQLRGLIGYDEPDDVCEDCAECDESDLMVLPGGMVGPKCYTDSRLSGELAATQ